MRLAFLGTPDFARVSLARLADAGHQIACVYSQPPAPRGRGHDLKPSPVHALALERVGAVVIRSELEARFLRLCRRFGIRVPEVNVVIEGIECDFVWRGARLVVEADGHRFHGTRSAFEEDRQRDVALGRAGWRVARFTYAQITGEPADVAAAILDFLRLGPPMSG